MNINIKGIDYHLSEETKAFIDKKLAKLNFASEYISNLDLTITRETKGQGFSVDAKINFNWKKVKVVTQSCYELYEGIELIADKIVSVVKKEKEKVISR